MSVEAIPTGRRSLVERAQAGKRGTRVWIDLCADVFHYGHANAIRQAKLLGDTLVVGVHPDEEIRAAKGPPVIALADRLAVVAACKWVDEYTGDAPYQTALATLDRFDVDFCVHGEDISVGADGRDSFYEVKRAGRFKLIKRTEGISTTDMVLHMLKITDPSIDLALDPQLSTLQAAISSRTIALFTEGNRAPREDDVRVYIGGVWDILHRGHVWAIDQARRHGTYLIVGIHSDADVRAARGLVHPIMSLHERSLLVLSMRYVDEVIMGAPVRPSADFLRAHRIDVVAGSSLASSASRACDGDPLVDAKAMGIYREFPVAPDVSTGSIIDHVTRNRHIYESKMSRKMSNRELESAISSGQQS
jgi:ethanolamine-phosphate cytidylyltransferase